MTWLKLINNESFKEWLISTGSGLALPQGGRFRLDPFGSSLRKFNNAHTWLLEFSQTGTFNPTGRKTQAISDLASAEILTPQETFTELGQIVIDAWTKYEIPDGDADYEIHRCLLLVSASFRQKESRYQDYFRHWIELRKLFSFEFLITNKIYLYLFSYLNKTFNNFNPYEFIKALNLDEDFFDVDVDWQQIKAYYASPAVDTAVDKYSSTIAGYLTREGRSSMCIALELLKSNLEEREKIIKFIGLNGIHLEKLELILESINFIREDVSSQQTIFYGSPGTGKSHVADSITYGKNVEKVTFHPDYDYHSFVGGYKPTMVGDKIAYKFVPQIFTKIYVDAWKNLVSTDETKPFYLQIEEINRGNCAEIFGDLFQLLDRDKDGFSKYEVTSEEELHKHLLSADGFGGNHPGIKNGKLRFPNNLKIIATMNTSDQSLFPMDSAFKRRWDWVYVPIDTDCKYSDFTIQLDNGKAFEWLSFLKVINKEIFEATKSQDKQIGNWFINAQNSGKVISESTFVNKVIFYLWNDVFKDEENTVFKPVDNKNLTYTSFFENGTSNNLVSYILEERLKLTDLTKAVPTTTEEE